MRRAAAIMLSLTLLTCLLPVVHAQDTQQRAEQARARLEQLQSRIEQVEKALDKGNRQHKKLADQLARTGRAVRHTAHLLKDLNADIAKLEKKVAALRDKRDSEKAQLGDQLDALRTQVRAAYRTGQTNKLRLLLSGRDPARIGRTLVYYEYFTEAQSKQVAHLREDLAGLAKRQAALEAEQHKLDARQSDRAATLARLKHSRKQRKVALAALENKLATHKSTLKDYRQSAAHLKDLIGKLHRKLQQPTPAPAGKFTALKGHMEPPVDGRIIAHFGAPKANGKMHWEGQWRAASKGAPVHAVAAGRVVYVGYMHHYGLIVVLEHAGGYFTVYGHTLSSYVEIGDQVNRNQVIARAGHSGGHKRTGVYFELRKGEHALNPSKWLRGS